MNFNWREVAAKLPTRGGLAVGGATLVGIVFVYALFSLASSPSYTTVVAGVQPSQTGKITSALSTAGVPYQLSNNGTAVAVQTTDEAQARVVLGEQGLLVGSGGSSGLESYLGKSSLGASSEQQTEQATSALEEQLDEQIESMNGINSAQVALAIPDQASNLFSETNTEPTGSVLLNTSSTLDDGAVKAVASLVAGAVTGLSADKVTVTDQDGDLLWPTSGSGGAAGLTTQQAAENAYDAQAAAKADSLLTSTLGPGKALVQVASDLNTNQETQSSVTYGTKPVPLSQTSSTETLTGTPSSAGAAGTTATSYAATGASGNGKSNYKSQSTSTTNAIDKTVTQAVISPGSINSQSISVLLNSSVPSADIPTIQAAVENAVGFKSKRDSISVGRIPFAKVPAATAASPVTEAESDVKYLAVGIGVLVFLVLLTRALRRRERQSLGTNPPWMRELEFPRPLAALEDDQQLYDRAQPVAVARLRSPSNPARKQIEDLVDRDPERVASQLRQWIGED